MAYSRMIHSNFFDSPELSKYTEKEKYFMLGLVCFADDFGKIWLNIERLRVNIFIGNSKATSNWILNTIDKFIEDSILCKYVVNGIKYCHFPNWFVKGWFLKQRIDNPRDNINPDCPLCQTEYLTRKKRETSRPMKEKLYKENRKKEGTVSKNGANPQHISNLINTDLIEKHNTND